MRLPGLVVFGRRNVRLSRLPRPASCVMHAAIDLITPGTLQSDYEEEAQWILLGAYLQMNEKEKADSLATVIYRAEGVFSAQAEQIIHKLK